MKSNAQVVQVGAGSYSTSLPSGEIGPQNASGQNILPKVSNRFDQRVQTNDFIEVIQIEGQHLHIGLYLQ